MADDPCVCTEALEHRSLPSCPPTVTGLPLHSELGVWAGCPLEQHPARSTPSVHQPRVSAESGGQPWAPLTHSLPEDLVLPACPSWNYFFCLTRPQRSDGPRQVLGTQQNSESYFPRELNPQSGLLSHAPRRLSARLPQAPGNLSPRLCPLRPTLCRVQLRTPLLPRDRPLSSGEGAGRLRVQCACSDPER